MTEVRTLQARLTAARAKLTKTSHAASLADATRSIYTQSLYVRVCELQSEVNALDSEIISTTADMNFAERAFACFTDAELLGQGYNVAAMRASL